MRSAVVISTVALLGFRSYYCDGLCVGTDHACVLLDDASVKCFGLNDYGQLGQGDTDARGQNATSMGDSLGPVDLGTRATVLAMSAGADHTCVVLSGGSVKCFGKNDKGQLGLDDTENRGDDPSEMGDELPAVSLGVNQTAVAVSAEGDRTCVLLESGSVRCWGDAQFGGLGSGDETNTGDGSGTVADSVDLGGSAVATAIGEGPCAVLEDGGLKCWGKGFYGKNGQGAADNLGDEPGEMGDDLPTVPLGTGTLAHSVVGGRDYNCAVLTNGDVKCWGRGEAGQAGSKHIATIGDDPDEMGDALPTVSLGTAETAVEVTAASQHTCALLGSGGVKCWGRGFFGNLGLDSYKARGHAPGTMGDDLPFVDLGTNRTVLSVKAGGERTCAILDDGSLKCWGDNQGGQLGLGDTAPRGGAPSQMGDDLPAVSLGTGRTAVPLAGAALALPTEAPTGAPTSAPTASPTPAPTPQPSTAAPTARATAPPVALVPSPAPRSPPTPSPAPRSSPTPTPSPVPTLGRTPSPTAEVEAEDRGGDSDGDGFLQGASTTVVVSIAAPVSIMMLLLCLFCVAKRKRQDESAAAVSARPEDSGSVDYNSSTRSFHGADNTVEGSSQAGVV